MKIHPISPLVAVAGLAVSLALTTFGAGVAPRTPAAVTPEEPSTDSAKKGTLEKGMSAEEIVSLIGRPESVSPLKMDEVKAEKWTYRKLLSQRVEQVATSVVATPAYIGTGGAGNNDLGARPEMQYSLKHIATYQVTALLMVNNHLILARQWNEDRVTYNP